MDKKVKQNWGFGKLKFEQLEWFIKQKEVCVWQNLWSSYHPYLNWRSFALLWCQMSAKTPIAN